jgi:hypothetical protein
MRDRREMMGRNACRFRSCKRGGVAIVTNDHNDLALDASGRAPVENALKRSAFMRGQNPNFNIADRSLSEEGTASVAATLDSIRGSVFAGEFLSGNRPPIASAVIGRSDRFKLAEPAIVKPPR